MPAIGIGAACPGDNLSALTPTIAIIAVYIGWQQWRTNEKGRDRARNAAACYLLITRRIRIVLALQRGCLQPQRQLAPRRRTFGHAIINAAAGSAWHRFAWRDALREAVTAARLPDDVGLYSIRHAAISEMLTAGLDPLSVARLAGTSVTMISKHYGHLVQDHVRAQLAAVRVL